MSNQPEYWNKAKKYLSKKDRIMKNLIKKYSDENLKWLNLLTLDWDHLGIYSQKCSYLLN